MDDSHTSHGSATPYRNNAGLVDASPFCLFVVVVLFVIVWYVISSERREPGKLHDFGSDGQNWPRNDGDEDA